LGRAVGKQFRKERGGGESTSVPGRVYKCPYLEKKSRRMAADPKRNWTTGVNSKKE